MLLASLIKSDACITRTRSLSAPPHMMDREGAVSPLSPVEQRRRKRWTLRGNYGELRTVVPPHTYPNDWRIAANCSLFPATSTPAVGPPAQFRFADRVSVTGESGGG